ncbi:Ciliary-associated calcium-binding coiled-coil protein 1 [Lamellibrachia satsuma]|nr:Ciliary-associated calcium-binding coiled-coil protein 1 [Lamellibrachia satsuma]
MNTPKKSLQKKFDKGKIAKRSRSARNSEPDGFAADSEEEEKPTLAFKVLNAEQTKELSEIDDVDQLEAKLAEAMSITGHLTDLKAATVLDYYVAAFWWGKEQNFNVEQLSSFFTVVHTLLENIKEKTLTLLDNLKEFKRMLAGVGLLPLPPQPEQESMHTVAETQSLTEMTGPPPVPTTVLDCFNIVQAKAMSDYLHSSIFKHYKLYEYMFSHTQAEELIGTDLEVEVPKLAEMPWPPPLEEGLSDEIYHTYIDIPPPKSPSQQTVITADEAVVTDVVDEPVPLNMEPSMEVVGDILNQLSANPDTNHHEQRV